MVQGWMRKRLSQGQGMQELEKTFQTWPETKAGWEVLTIRVHALCHKRWNKLACLNKASSLLCALIWRLIKMQLPLEVSKLGLPTAPVAREIIKTKRHARSIFNAVWTACLMRSESPQSVQNSQRIKSDFIYEGKVRVKWSVQGIVYCSDKSQRGVWLPVCIAPSPLHTHTHTWECIINHAY